MNLRVLFCYSVTENIKGGWLKKEAIFFIWKKEFYFSEESPLIGKNYATICFSFSEVNKFILPWKLSGYWSIHDNKEQPSETFITRRNRTFNALLLQNPPQEMKRNPIASCISAKSRL